MTRRDLNDELDHDANWWSGTGTTAQPGDTLIGTITNVLEFDGDFGPYPVLELRCDDGTFSNLSCARSVLRNEIEKQRPGVGDRIGVRYIGPETSSKGTSYEKYRVRIDRQTPATPRPDVDTRTTSSSSQATMPATAAVPAEPLTNGVTATSPTADQLAVVSDDEPF